MQCRWTGWERCWGYEEWTGDEDVEGRSMAVYIVVYLVRRASGLIVS